MLIYVYPTHCSVYQIPRDFEQNLLIAKLFDCQLAGTCATCWQLPRFSLCKPNTHLVTQIYTVTNSYICACRSWLYAHCLVYSSNMLIRRLSIAKVLRFSAAPHWCQSRTHKQPRALPYRQASNNEIIFTHSLC